MRRFQILTLACLSALITTSCGEEEATFEYQTHAVRRGDVRIFVRQKGTIEAEDPCHVPCPIEGRSTILDIVPEGSLVAKGDVLFTLDVSEQEDKKLQQKISESSAAQGLANAQEQFEIQKLQNESDVKQAELKVLFAELDLRQYQEGELPQDLRALEAEITLAKEELKRSEETRDWSKKLLAKGYIASEKFESDKLSVKRRELEVTLTKQKVALLNEFTAVKRKRELTSDLEEFRRELKRVHTKTKASLNQRVSDLTAKKAQHDLEVTKLDRLLRQIEDNSVRAPRAGLVVYAREGRSRDSKPIEPGTSVRQGQVVVTIPDMTKVQVDVDVHESWVQQIELGMPVVVSTDTGLVLDGVIESIASVPDSQSWYRNPDLKVYSTKVTVQNLDGRLKPGMNCQAEIIIEEFKSVLSLPVQAVHSNGQAHFCYVKSAEGPVLTEVKVGKHNGENVVIESGIEEGADIYLAIPPDVEPLPTRQAVKRVTPKREPAESVRKRTADNSRKTGDGAGKPSDDARKKMMERLNKLTPEAREAMRKRYKQGGGRPGGERGRRGGSGSGRGRSGGGVR